MHSLNKLTCRKHSKGEVTSALARDDLTGTRLDAGQVIEARAKEVQYIKDKRCIPKSPEKKPRQMDGRSSKHGGLISTRVTTPTPCTEVVW